MAITVAFKNPQSGEIKPVKVGWSWILFLFSGFFGIPLFQRKLVMWGFAFLALNIIGVFMQLGSGQDGAGLFTSLVQIVGAIFVGIKGNEITAKNYLARGWKFVDPNSDMTRFAKMQWQILDPQSPPQVPNADTTRVG